MDITKEMLLDEIKVLQKASSLHAKYSIKQYKEVLTTLDALEEEKKVLEKKVKERTQHLEVEIQQKESLANKLEKLAKYDQLTGLANRYLFLDELELVYKESVLLNKQFSLFFIDLDGFKLINDTYGHKVGDLLLQTVSMRLKSIVRSEDLIARLGGDEFTIILKNIKDVEKIKDIAVKVIDEIKQSIKVDAELEVYVGSSIGIYLYTQDDIFEDIVSKADIAMYEAKKAGKGTYVFFDTTMQEELLSHTALKTKVKDALENDEFENFFQPIVLSTDHSIKSAEVLIRWRDADKLISPAVFIPILEEDRALIKNVTFWQIKKVVEVLIENDLIYSINISAKLLNNDELVLYMQKLLQLYDFNPTRIYFEVTETTLSSNLSQASKILLELKEMGFNLSLDDFGTGYSSLAYIRELPLDTIKIDKKFLDNIPYSTKDRKLLRSIINMAKILDMRIILEGIETQEQLDLLEKDNYIKYQGFFFHKPLPQERFLEVLRSDR